jgi:hypothetical protein
VCGVVGSAAPVSVRQSRRVASSFPQKKCVKNITRPAIYRRRCKIIFNNLESSRHNRQRGVERGWSAMRGVGVIVALGLALLGSGCDPNDASYFRGGIGTDLYTPDVASTTELQNIYLDNLCRQSEPHIGPAVPDFCAQEVVPTTAWPVIVQAGLNDIDTRCDSYLAWLDQKKRENAGILTEIGAVRFAVDALTNPAVVTVSPVALAAVAAAFGLATNTVNNFNSLLLQVDHTTVQSVVFVNRRIFREKLLKLPIDNKPMAIHALRSYLTICLPMTISANINSTVTVFQQAGPNAIDPEQLVSTSTIGKPFRAATVTGVPPARLTGAPTIPAFKAIIVNYDPNVHTTELVDGLARKLCLTDADAKNTSKMTGAIQVYQMTLRDLLGKPSTNVTGKLTDAQILSLDDEAKCNNTKFQNFFEASKGVPGGITNPNVIPLLNKKLPKDQQLAPGATEAQIRAGISELQQSLSNLTLRSSALRGQMTPDLFGLLQSLP